jgi:hypothetical protein
MDLVVVVTRRDVAMWDCSFYWKDKDCSGEKSLLADTRKKGGREKGRVLSRRTGTYLSCVSRRVHFFDAGSERIGTCSTVSYPPTLAGKLYY